MDWQNYIVTDSQVLENYPTVTSEALRAIYAYAAQILSDEVTYPIRRTGT